MITFTHRILSFSKQIYDVFKKPLSWLLVLSDNNVIQYTIAALAAIVYFDSKIRLRYPLPLRPNALKQQLKIV